MDIQYKEFINGNPYSPRVATYKALTLYCHAELVSVSQNSPNRHRQKRGGVYAV